MYLSGPCHRAFTAKPEEKKKNLLANEAVNGCLWQTLVVAKVGGGKGVFSGKRVADLLPFVLVAPLPHLCH